MKNYFLVHLSGGTDPNSIGNGCDTFKQVREEALTFIQTPEFDSECDGIFYMTIENGIPQLNAFSGADLDF